MAAAAAHFLQPHKYLSACLLVTPPPPCSSSSSYSLLSEFSSSHLPRGFSQNLASLQFDNARLRTVASWPLKQNMGGEEPPKIKTKISSPKRDKPRHMSKPKLDMSKLLKRSAAVDEVAGSVKALQTDHQTWLPSAPKVSDPRSIYNAASLAYLGDCIYELYARRHFLFPPLSINEYNSRVMAVVCCEAQDALLRELLKDTFLSTGERDVIRWGRNIESGKTRTIRRAGAAVYNRASSLETLVGYLYLTNVDRLDEVMGKLGFCTDHAS